MAVRATTMYLLSHKQPATTARSRPTCCGCRPPPQQNSGHTTPPSTPAPPPTPRRRNPEPSEMTRGLPAVRGRGLEPRWLLTASTSSGAGPSRSKDSAELGRQEAQGAAGSGEFRSHVTGILGEGTRARKPSPTWSLCAWRRPAGDGRRSVIVVRYAGRCWNCCTRSNPERRATAIVVDPSAAPAT